MTTTDNAPAHLITTDDDSRLQAAFYNTAAWIIYGTRDGRPGTGGWINGCMKAHLYYCRQTEIA